MKTFNNTEAELKISVACKKRVYIVIVIFSCYLEGENYKDLTFYVISFSCFEKSPSLF